MNHYCTGCGVFAQLDALSYLCGGCADTWTRRKAAEAQEAGA